MNYGSSKDKYPKPGSTTAKDYVYKFTRNQDKLAFKKEVNIPSTQELKYHPIAPQPTKALQDRTAVKAEDKFKNSAVEVKKQIVNFVKQPSAQVTKKQLHKTPYQTILKDLVDNIAYSVNVPTSMKLLKEIQCESERQRQIQLSIIKLCQCLERQPLGDQRQKLKNSLASLGSYDRYGLIADIDKELNQYLRNILSMTNCWKLVESVLDHNMDSDQEVKKNSLYLDDFSQEVLAKINKLKKDANKTIQEAQITKKYAEEVSANYELYNKMKSAQSKQRNTTDLSTDILKLQKRKEQLQLEIGSLEKQRLGRQTDVQKLNREMERAREEERKSYGNKIPSSQNLEFRNEKKTILGYKSQIEHLITERTTLEHQVRAKKKQTEQLQQKNNNLRSEHARLSEQISIINRQLSTLQTQETTIRQINEQKNQLARKNQLLETDNHSQAQQLKTKTQEIQRMRVQFKSKQKDTQEIIRQMTSSIKAKDEYIEKLQRQMQQLSNQLEQTKIDRSRQAANQSSFGQLQQQNQDQEIKIRQLIRRQADLERQNKVSSDRETRGIAQINDLRRQNKDLQDKVRALTQQREADRQKYMAQISSLNHGLTERDTKQVKQKHYVNTLEGQINQLKSHNQQLQNALSEEKHRTQALNENLSRQQNETNNIKGSLVKQQLENQQYVALVKELENKIYQLENKINQLEKDKAEIARDNASLVREVHQYKQKSTLLQKQNQEAQQGRRSFFEDKGRTSNQISVLNHENCSLKTRINQLQQRLNKTEQQKSDVLKELDQARRQSEFEIKSRQKDSSNATQALQAEILSLKSQVDRLESKLKQQIQQNSTLSTQLQQHEQTLAEFFEENKSNRDNLLLEQSERQRIQKQLQSLRRQYNNLVQNNDAEQQQSKEREDQDNKIRQSIFQIQRLKQSYQRQQQGMILKINQLQQLSGSLAAKNRQLEEQIQSLTSNIQIINEQQSRLTQQMEDASRLSMDLRSARDQAREKEEALSRMRQYTSSLEKQVASLSQANNRLNTQYEQEKKKFHNYSEQTKQIIQQNQSDLMRIKIQNNNLADNLARATHRNTQAQGLEAELNRCKIEADDYRNKCSGLTAQNQQQKLIIEQLDRQLKLLQSGNRDSAQRATQVENQVQSLRYTVQEKERQIAALNIKAEQLHSQIVATRRATEKSSRDIKIKEDELRQAHSKLNYSDRQIAMLKNYKSQKDKTDEIYHQNLKMLQQNFEKLKGEYLILHKKYEIVSQEKESLQKKAEAHSRQNLAYVQSLQKSISQKQQLVKELTASNLELEARIQPISNKHSPTTKRYDPEKTQLQNEVFKLKQEVSILKEQLSTKEKQLNRQGQRIKALENECNGLKSQLRNSAKQQVEMRGRNNVELQKQFSPKREDSGSQQLSVNHLFHGEVLRGLNDYKVFIKESIQKRINLQIVDTKLIYQYDELNKINIHKYIDNKEHIVMIVQVGTEAEIQEGKRKEDCYYIAAYSEGCLKPKTASDKDGIIMSLNNRKCYYPLEKNKKATVYDEYFVIFGNSEIRIKSQEKKVFSNFGLNSSYYKHDGDTVSVLFGGPKNQREVPFIHCEVHQLILR